MRILFVLLFLVCACAKTEPSTGIIDNIKKDITIIDKQIENVKDTLPAECQTSAVKSQFENLREQVKTISAKAETVDVACKTEKEVLRQENSKLKIIIGFLILIFAGLIVLKIRKVL